MDGDVDFREPVCIQTLPLLVFLVLVFVLVTVALVIRGDGCAGGR